MSEEMTIGPAPTEEQWHIMVDKDMGKPLPFKTASLQSCDWVYFRPWGIIPVASGMHTCARATLLAWHLGCKGYIDLMRSRKLEDYNGLHALADAFLMEIPGTAFLSSMSMKTVIAGKRANLYYWEKKQIRSYGFEIRYLEDTRY